MVTMAVVCGGRGAEGRGDEGAGFREWWGWGEVLRRRGWWRGWKRREEDWQRKRGRGGCVWFRHRDVFC